jgi:molybdopterin/thiamine biosynthesis adenylyltransferase
MRYTVTFTHEIFEKLRRHLLRDKKEQLASVLCGLSKTNDKITFLSKEIIKAQPKDLESNSTVHVSAQKEYRKKILTRCLEGNLSVIDCHSHPFAEDKVGFSQKDDLNDLTNLRYIKENIPGIECGSAVFSMNEFKARIYEHQTNSLIPVEEITIIGKNIKKISGEERPIHFETFDRQILLFGKEGQKKLSETSVAVVGAGGTGSLVAVMLTRLGVGKLIIIDPDNIETTNLNRLIAATPKNVNQPKPEVLKRYAETYATTRIEAVRQSILHPEALDKLKEVDTVFSCTDNQVSRMVQNESAVKYHKILIDLGTGITRKKGNIECGGQVRIVLPDGFCLSCIDGIDYAKAGEELLNPEDRKMRRNAGYVKGRDIPSPSVISLNATIASLAVTEFLNLVTGIREPNTYVTYDAQSSNIVAQTLQAQKDQDCPVCGKNGVRAMGDLIPNANLLEDTTPENIPEVPRG